MITGSQIVTATIGAEIDQIESDTDRQRVVDLFQKVGGSLPTFQIVAERLFSFVVKGPTFLAELVSEHPEFADLGSPSPRER